MHSMWVATWHLLQSLPWQEMHCFMVGFTILVGFFNIFSNTPLNLAPLRTHWKGSDFLWLRGENWDRFNSQLSKLSHARSMLAAAFTALLILEEHQPFQMTSYQQYYNLKAKERQHCGSLTEVYPSFFLHYSHLPQIPLNICQGWRLYVLSSPCTHV